jgi:putative hydrolase of HD superfamily
LAKEEKADAYKVLLMCLAHDIGEARSNDQNWVHKRYVKVFEEEILKDQTKDLPNGPELKKVLEEYMERESKEAVIAKDADLIDQMMLLKEYIHQGNKEAATWLAGSPKNPNKKNKHFQLLKTKSGIKLAKEILKQTPSDWWKNIWTEKRR